MISRSLGNSLLMNRYFWLVIRWLPHLIVPLGFGRIAVVRISSVALSKGENWRLGFNILSQRSGKNCRLQVGSWESFYRSFGLKTEKERCGIRRIMCMLCVIQKCSRRIATMLPWLVIPLIGLWTMSQLLPPAFRFEITSPRLACVMVLLATLFWYEILMPQLSAWRSRRNTMLRERMRFEAIEMQKLRKTATRRCRNCLTAYRDQNPGGGKFMCSYCGHISKRPVLDLPMPPDVSNLGILKDLIGKGGRLLNGKAWSENGLMCGPDWLEHGNWVGGPFSGKSSYWRKNGDALFGGDEGHCLAEKSYSRVFSFASKALTSFFLCIMWLWKKIFRVGSSIDDPSTDVDHGLVDNRGENGGNSQESRGEKARRKAEEKRLVRIEKELLEEEERKQREEVARLVEERRRLRDEKMEAGKECGKGSPHAKERDSRKESERKRQEKRKEKDRASSKSNSDVEELDKRSGKESDRLKKTEIDKREQKRVMPEGTKPHYSELGHGVKSAAASNNSRNAGTRYLDRMRGTFLSSSRAWGFGKSVNASTVLREQKPSSLIENSQTFPARKEIVQPERVSGAPILGGDNKIVNRPVLSEPQPFTSPKKSWHHLFNLSSAASPPSGSSAISKPAWNGEAEDHAQPFTGQQTTSTQSFDKPVNFGLPPPFSLPSFHIGSSSGSKVVSIATESLLSKTGHPPHQFLPEESEIFEDPCYVPDPISLLGPVSESLDNFQLDRGFVADRGLQRPSSVKTKAAPPEVTKPSPIESPLSRSRFSEERHCNSFAIRSTPKAHDNSIDTNEMGTWQMWNSTPLGRDGFGLIGGPISWLLHPEVNLPNKEDVIHPLPQKTMASSLYKKDELAISGTHPSQDFFFGNFQNGGMYNESAAVVDGSWLPNTLFSPSLSAEKQILMEPKGEAVENRLKYGDYGGSVGNHQFELSAANFWAKKDWAGQGPRDGVGSSPVIKPHIGGLYSSPDVQSLWSYD